MKGGARANAGRKRMSEDEKRARVTVWVAPETKEGMAILRERGVRIGAKIDGLVSALLDNQE